MRKADYRYEKLRVVSARKKFESLFHIYHTRDENDLGLGLPSTYS